jgi:hypothetical protein
MSQEFKWRGVPLSELDKAQLEQALTHTHAIAAAIRDEIQRQRNAKRDAGRPKPPAQPQP